MRSLFLSVGLGALALGLLGAAPSEAHAWGRRFYGASYYPVMTVYAYPVMAYYPPPRPVYYPAVTRYYARYSYAPPVMPCPSGYAPPASYAPSYGPPSYGPPQPGALTVGVYDDYFRPPTITVPPGATVRWANYGRHVHTVTAGDGRWDSGDLGPGASYTYTFNQPGTYEYYCRHHTQEGMRGTVVVR